MVVREQFEEFERESHPNPEGAVQKLRNRGMEASLHMITVYHFGGGEEEGVSSDPKKVIT